jgi:hypothetical protein
MNPGIYNLIVATDLDLDRNHKNDTLNFLINKLAFRDLALEYIVPESEAIICANATYSSIIFRNLGVDTIHSILLQVTHEEVPVDTLSWTGHLALGEQITFEFEVEDLTDGLNHIAVNLLELNQSFDEIPSNNELVWTLTANPQGAGAVIRLITDNFPQETTWELLNQFDEVIASGGPYDQQQNLYTSSLCLDPETCYTFIIYDAFGDGMSAQGVHGFYEITDNNGDVLASIVKPNFGHAETNHFCLTAQCQLTLEVGVVNESMPGAGDAFVIGDASNGLGTIMYSIDGGLNFQSDNVFLNVPPGMYVMLAMDDAGCQDTASFTVLTCTLQTMITTVPASGGDVGEIHIVASGGIGPVVFSLNGGPFTPDSVYTMLEPGNYVVVTRDSVGCERTDSVMVSTNVATHQLAGDDFIQISPNPGHDLFQISGKLNTKEIFIDYTLLTGTGEILMNGSIVRYDDIYKGELSLRAYPSGIYYAVFHVNGNLLIRRIIKAE